MERRCSGRAPLKIKVVIYHQGLPVLISETGNISRRGLFLKADPGALPNRSRVEVEFTLCKDGHTISHRLQAVVIHTRGGLGLMYSRDNPVAVPMHAGSTAG